MWIADTGSGVFEERSLKELASQMAENGQEIWYIDEIYFQNCWGGRSTLSKQGFNEFLGYCEKLNREFIENYKNEEGGLRFLKSDYYASLL